MRVCAGASEQVQDQAAGLVVALLDPQPGECVLDACAAPGGKALFAASRMCGRVGKRGQVRNPLESLSATQQRHELVVLRALQTAPARNSDMLRSIRCWPASI